MNRTKTKCALADPITVDIEFGGRRCDRLALTPTRCVRFHAKYGLDFDITNPPLEPVIPPGKDFLGFIETSLRANDVMLGRGQNTSRRAGNRLFRFLVADFRPMYRTLRWKEKRKIARTIVLIVRQRGGRFLRRVGEDGSENVHGQLLFEAGDERAEKKTAQALREGLDVRDKTRNLKGRFSHQEKVDDDKEMSVEHQESLNEGSVVAWQEGQEMAMLSKSKNPQSTQDLRECLYLKTTPIALKEHVSHQGKAGDSDRMAAECQEPHDEGAAKALRWGEAPARTIGGTNTQTTRYGNDNCKEYYQTEKLCDGWPSSLTGRRTDTSVTLLPGL